MRVTVANIEFDHDIEGKESRLIFPHRFVNQQLSHPVT